MRVLEDRRTIFSSHSPADASIARMVIALLFSSSSFFGVFPFLITLESPRGFLSCHPPSIHSSSFSTDSASLSLYLPWLSGVHPERLSLNQTSVDFSRIFLEYLRLCKMEKTGKTVKYTMIFSRVAIFDLYRA